jgi:hypothetical protein
VLSTAGWLNFYDRSMVRCLFRCDVCDHWGIRGEIGQLALIGKTYRWALRSDTRPGVAATGLLGCSRHDTTLEETDRQMQYEYGLVVR